MKIRASLQQRLIHPIITFIVLLWVSAAVLIVSISSHEALKASDRTLEKIANVLGQWAEGVDNFTRLTHDQVNNPNHLVAIAADEWPSTSKVCRSPWMVARVQNKQGNLLFHCGAIPWPAERFWPKSGFGWIATDGVFWRYYVWLGKEGQRVEVMESYQQRLSTTPNVEHWLIIIGLIVIPIFGGILTITLRSALTPVNSLISQLYQRPDHDLSPLDTNDLPSEVYPLVIAINRLFAEIRVVLDRERRFTADASHELRSPIASVSLNAQLIRRSLNANKTIDQEILDNLEKGIIRCDRLISQCLHLAKYDDYSNVSYSATPTDLEEIIDQILSELTDRIEKKELNIKKSISTAWIYMESTAALVLIRNLIDNAIQYTPENGSITIELETKNQYVHFLIHNTGIGIPTNQQPYIFDRFFRGQNPNPQGTGLGLAIVHRIVSGYRGRISLDSGKDVSGTTFKIVLPVTPHVSNTTLH